MLTVEEVAEELRVTKQTIYNWINAGKINVVRVFGLLRIEKEEVERIKRGE
jgi:excisionase family DNA binding protein